MRRRKAYDAFTPATTLGGTYPAEPMSPYVVPKTETTTSPDAVPESIEVKQPTPLKIQLHYGNWPLWLLITPACTLHLGNVPFELIRWPKFFDPEMKQAADRAMVLNPAPWIVVNGTPLTQTTSIIKFCSDLAGLTPNDLFLASQVDSVISICMEFHEVWNAAILAGRNAHKEGDTNLVQKIVTKLNDVDGAKYFNHFEQLLVLNDCEKNPGFIVGNAMTTADITLWKLVGTLSQDHSTSSPVLFWNREITERYPHLNELVCRLNAHPLLHNYVLELFPHGQGESPYPGRMALPLEGCWPGMGFTLEPPDQKWMRWWEEKFNLSWSHMD